MSARWKFWKWPAEVGGSDLEKRLVLIEKRLEGQAARLLRYESALDSFGRTLQLLQDDLKYLNRVEWLASGRPLSCEATLDLPKSLLKLFDDGDDD